jgi:hypothetical protein
VNRTLEPAFFSGAEATEEIDRLSRRHGSPPRIIPMPQRSGVPYGMIASWGNVVLEPLDASSVSELAAARDVHRGFLIDHIANFQRSAQLGLPIYRLRGRAGYVWAASYDQSGRGTLRFLTIDASLLPEPVALTPPPPPSASLAPLSPVTGVAPLPTSAPTSTDAWKDCQSKDTETRLNGCTVVINANGFGSQRRLADALDGRCWAYNEKKQYDRALIDCKTAIQLAPL